MPAAQPVQRASIKKWRIYQILLLEQVGHSNLKNHVRIRAL
jgi:hypothetical protein